MRIILLYILFLPFIGFSQIQYSAMIDITYLGEIEIYDNPGGSVVKKMRNDSINEDFLYLNILQQTPTHFYVFISYSVQKDSITGWIKKENYIGAYIKNDKYPMDLILYNRCINSEKTKVVYSDWTPAFLTIDKYHNGWLYVTNTQNGKKIKGWIQTEGLCANPYSTCS
ncbi:MAG: hypothetical protein U0U66_14160 [Cytophagaceae bacterium]